MNDFRSFIAEVAEWDSWLGTLAKEVRASGWSGATPESLQDHLKNQGKPTEYLKEISNLKTFFDLYRSRHARFNKR